MQTSKNIDIDFLLDFHFKSWWEMEQIRNNIWTYKMEGGEKKPLQKMGSHITEFFFRRVLALLLLLLCCLSLPVSPSPNFFCHIWCTFHNKWKRQICFSSMYSRWIFFPSHMLFTYIIHAYTDTLAVTQAHTWTTPKTHIEQIQIVQYAENE